jgi:subtilisin family serine protease
MKCYRWIMFLTLLVAAVQPASAQQRLPWQQLPQQQLPQLRLIVRDNLGQSGLKITCAILNCNVGANLGDPAGQLFLITVNTSVNLNSLLTGLLNQVGIVDAEVDQQLFLVEGTVGPVPESLIDSTPLTYYGAPVWNGYVNQPAAVIVRVLPAQSSFNVTGAGSMVAMIDTGVDTQHPALVPVLVPGYNFINNTPSGSEMGDVNESTAAVLDGGGSPAPAVVNSSTIAVVNESTAAVLDGGPNGDFGHGTMTAGIVHLVAPQAQIMPLKAFAADGSGYVSNIIRATYYAVQNGANVLSMSFSFSPSSNEMGTAINYANSQGVICVASAGNSGADVQVYPAALPNVMAVASVSDYGTPSSFSNYGSDVWVAAPGEGIVSTYPYGTYSAGWGTSFSAPFVSGTAALLVNVSANVNQQSAAAAIANTQPVSGNGMGNGELDVYQSVQAWVTTVNQQ